MGIFDEDKYEVFEVAYNFINEWQPEQNYNSENKYHEDLFKFLSSKAKKYPLKRSQEGV